MTVAVRCSACGRSFQVPEANLGSKGKCPRCGQLFTLATVTNASQETYRPITDPNESAAPTKVGRFEIRKRLGAGAFGTVYQGVDPMLKREVAVKLQRISGMRSEDDIQRMLREPQAVARLRHGNIVPIYEAGRDQDHFYIASAFIDGETLAEAMTAKKFGTEETVRIVARLAEALDYAHRQGIVHRDVKPANVMLDTSGEPQLMDFGLARFAESSVQLTHAGAVLGTPAFMSPEQAGGRGDVVGPATDQYALGVVLYQMLSGRLPFDGMPQVVIYHICNTPVTPLKQVAPHVPGELSDICMRAMQKDPAARYASCRELAGALNGWLTRLSSPSLVAIVAEPVAPAPSSPPMVAPSGKTAIAKPAKPAKPATPGKPALPGNRATPGAAVADVGAGNRRRIVWISAGGVGVAAVVLTALLWKGDEPEVAKGKPAAASESDGDAGVPESSGSALAAVASTTTQPTLPQPGATSNWNLTPATATRPTTTIAATTIPAAAIPAAAIPVSLPGTPTISTGPQMISTPTATQPTPIVPAAGGGVVPVGMNSIVNNLGMKLVLIPAGQFTMGSPAADAVTDSLTNTVAVANKDELPAHQVRITKPFYIGQTEVTQGQWLAVKGTSPWLNTTVQQGLEFPATSITYDDALDFCTRLGARDGATYRLPTEAEWEYACRADTTTRYSFGNDEAQAADYAWFGLGAFSYPHLVAQKKPNPWGLYDMHGNVYEWCHDWYGDTFYTQTPPTDPRGPVTGTQRVVRSGSYQSDTSKYCRSADRFSWRPDRSGDGIGFRVVREP